MKQALIISTTFFPHPEVAGVRMTQWCRFLPEFGWQPTVLCRHYGHTATPELLAEHVHPAVRVEYLPPIRERQATGSLTSPPPLRRFFESSGLSRWLLPDPAIVFWWRARHKILETVQRVDPDVILTTCPVFSVWVIGLWLHRRTGKPWVSDIRDPFLFDRRFVPQQGVRRITVPALAALQKQVYERAALIVHTIPFEGRWARLRFPEARHRIVTIPNGFPPELATDQVEPERAENGRLSVRVVGSISAEDAIQLGDTVAQLVERGQDLELRIISHLNEDAERAVRRRLGDRFVYLQRMRHDLALQQIFGADVLVSFLSQERSETWGMSTKLYEFRASGRPIIAVNPTVPDRQFLRQQPGTVVLYRPSTSALASAIDDALQVGTAQRRPPEFLERYNYRNQVRTFVDRLERIVPATAGD